MASVKRLLFGRPPFRILVNHLVQDEDFLSDARSLLAMQQEDCLRLAAELNKSDAFLSVDALVKIISEVAGDDNDPNKIASVVFKLSEMLDASGMAIDKAMDTLASAINERAKPLEPSERRVLTERIRLLAVNPAGLAKQHKAQRLLGELGSDLEDFRIVCDIRPVFDRPKERIEGAIPITILQLEYSKQDGDSEVIEVRISEKQVEALEKRCVEVRRKLKAIGELLRSTGVPVPNVEESVSAKE